MVWKNLRVVESFNSDVVVVITEDLRVRVGASRGGDGGGDEEGEYDELQKNIIVRRILNGIEGEL